MEIQKELDRVAHEAKAKIAEIETSLKADLSGKAEEQKQELTAKLDEWKAEYAKLDGEQQKQLDKLDAEVQKLRKEGMSAGAAVQKTLQRQLQEQFEAKKELFTAAHQSPGNKMNALPSFSLKAAGTMTFSASTTGVVVDREYVPGIFGTVRRRNRIRQTLAQGVTASDAVPFVTQTGGEGGATITGENGTKPATDKDIALSTASVRKIAHHIRVSEELLNDLPALSSFLSNQGIEDLYDTEDTQLLYGTGAGSPAQIAGLTVGSVLTASDVSLSTTNAQKIDAVLGACQALAANEYMADTILMNPADVYDIMALKATDREYLSRINFDTNGRLIIKGLPVFETTAVTAGDLIVGEFARAAQMFQREAPSVRFFDQDQDNAIQNLITIVIEERLALAKYYPDAIFFDSFADVIAAIT